MQVIPIIVARVIRAREEPVISISLALSARMVVILKRKRSFNTSILPMSSGIVQEGFRLSLENDASNIEKARNIFRCADLCRKRNRECI